MALLSHRTFVQMSNALIAHTKVSHMIRDEVAGSSGNGYLSCRYCKVVEV